MSTELIKQDQSENMERVLIGGDLAKLTADERVHYYKAVCDSVGLNPLTRPLEYITLNGKLTLYARKDCTDQLRSIHDISVNIVAREIVDDCYVVTSRARKPSGREDESIGAVPIGKLTGDAKCNAMMKAETKAKRRVTLSLCGLGMLDETEVESIPARSLQTVAVTEEPVTFTKPNGRPVAEEEPLPVAPAVATGGITPEQATKLHTRFRQSLREDLRDKADMLLYDFLVFSGYKREDGTTSALLVPAELFTEVGRNAVRHAKEL